MPTIGGHCWQQATGRDPHYWSIYRPVSESEVCFVAAMSEANVEFSGNLGKSSTHEGTFQVAHDGMPLELAIRSRILSYMERTAFPAPTGPDSKWIGWYRPHA